MNKTLIFSFLLCLFLASCSKQPQQYTSFDEAQHALKSLNLALYQPKNSKHAGLRGEQLPFTDAYLKKRHAIYQSLMQMQLTKQQTEQVNYLVIAERFPERYFAWPAHTNVLVNLLNLASSESDYQNISNWLEFVQRQLESAQLSNLKLNKIEHNLIKNYVLSALNDKNIPNSLLAQLNILKDYLVQYSPRGSVGLYGLANGSEWYQSKLNYFSGTVHSPLEWLTIINKQLKEESTQPANQEVSQIYPQSFLVQFTNGDKEVPGLDWLSGFRNLPAIAENKSLLAQQKTLMLAMMETDVGLHIHAWTLPQAKVNLIKRLNISEIDATRLVKNIVLYPGQAFSFAQQLL